MPHAFPVIEHISDVLPAVQGKPEFRFTRFPNGVTIGHYLFSDAGTFDSPQALECRGIAFDEGGRIISRPLHKFFNVGERAEVLRDRIFARKDLTGIYEKLDGSMLATALVEGNLQWRSKASFESPVVKLANAYLDQRENAGITRFARIIAGQGMTAIFELTHPQFPIVVAHERPGLRLLHVRENVSGVYVMLDPRHEVHALIEQYRVPVAPRCNTDLQGALDALKDMESREGYVVQFADGNMVKMKCPWYLRMHRSIALLRERDVAALALHGELDDVKGQLTEAGLDLSMVEEVESRVSGMLSALIREIESVCEGGRGLERKDFAEKVGRHRLFGLIMQHYAGRRPLMPSLIEWFEKNHLRQDFSLRTLTEAAIGGDLDDRTGGPNR